MRFNGDGVQELFTTRYDSSSFITAVEGSDGRAYIITYAETDRDVSSDTTEYDISVMPIGDSLGSREVVVENATSAVVDSDENSQFKSVFYTKRQNLVSQPQTFLLMTMNRYTYRLFC